MDVVNRPVGELVPYEKNAKKHDRRQIANVAESIRQYGFVQPVVIDRDGVIVIGHCRVLAAKKLGMTEVPCVSVDDLTPEQVNALRIVDNKTNESPWDLGLLAEELPELDLSGFEFDFDSVAKKQKEELVEDEVPAVDPVSEPVARVGDIWRLGRHRLLCGDSTSPEDLGKLLDCGTVECVVTDPPYNMAYEGGGGTDTEKRKKNRILNDKMSEADFADFLAAVYTSIKTALQNGGSFYAFYKELGTGVFVNTCKKVGLTFKQELIWAKNQIVLGGSKYQNMYEPCVFGCKGDQPVIWNGGRKQRSVIDSLDFMNEKEVREALSALLQELDGDVLREKKPLVNDLHPTMKPVKLIGKLICNSTTEGGSVLDLFGGSGTTMIACEQLGRTCYMLELDPKYCDVIIRRWENFTGGKAVKLN
jgi:site-specific DNA-methyltransferase (adenine-specific)